MTIIDKYFIINLMSKELNPRPEEIYAHFNDALLLESIVKEEAGGQNGYISQSITHENNSALFSASMEVYRTYMVAGDYAKKHINELQAMAKEEMTDE